MKKTLKLFIIIFSFIFVLNFYSCLAADKDIKKAGKLIEDKMFKQAITLLEKSIRDKPTNAEAHFLLGKCYIYVGQISNAQNCFQKTIKLDSEYGYKTTDEFFEAAVYATDKNEKDRARKLFSLAAEGMPTIKDKISDFYYEKGSKASSSKDVAYYFRLAKQFSNRHNDEISNYYYNKGRKYAEILNTIENRYKPYELSQYKNAVRMLAKYHGTGAVPALIEALKYCTWNHYKCCFRELGAEIIYYLGELKDKRAIPILKWAIKQSVGGSTSNPGEWASNLAAALIKLNAKECGSTIKDILIKFVEENSGAYWTMGGIRIKYFRLYLMPLTKFTGKPYEEINWEKVAKKINSLCIYNMSVRASLGGLDDKKYPKYSGKLREITNPLNYEKIKKWVFLIKEWEKLPSWGPIRTKASSYSWRSKYNLTTWNYGKVKLCDLKNNKIYLEVTRHPQGHHGQIIDASLITLTIKGEKIEVYDIQKGTTYQKAERDKKSKP